MEQARERGAARVSGIAPGCRHPAPVERQGCVRPGSAFVAAFEGLDEFVTEAGRVDCPEVYRFPAVLPREALVRTDYLRSFPDLVGSIHGFDGNDGDHAALLRELRRRRRLVGRSRVDRPRPAAGGLLSAVPDARGRAPRGRPVVRRRSVRASGGSRPTTRRACSRFTCTSSCTSARPRARSRSATGGSSGRRR